MRYATILLVLIGLLAGGAGCDPAMTENDLQAELETGDQRAETDDLESLRAEIEDLIGEPRAERVGQCRTIAFGSKPCGGPWRYLVYSSVETDSIALARLVDRYNQLQREINEREGWASDCAVVIQPDIALDGDLCILRTP